MNDEKDVARMDTMGDSTDSRTASAVAPITDGRLPWRFWSGEPRGHLDRTCAVLDADGRTVADNEPYYQSALGHKDGAYIVRAVNSHADLLAALKALINDITNDETLTMLVPMTSVYNAQAAIAKADGSHA